MQKIKQLILILFVVFTPLKLVEASEAGSQEIAGIEITVNINNADADEIAAMLKGIGKQKAQAIVDYREANGVFTSLEDLQKVKGIGAATVNKNKTRIQL